MNKLLHDLMTDTSDLRVGQMTFHSVHLANGELWESWAIRCTRYQVRFVTLTRRDGDWHSTPELLQN